MKRFIASVSLMFLSQLTALSQEGINCSGLRASWSFTNGSGVDSSGNGHQLALWGLSKTADRKGHSNCAYRFDNGPNTPVMNANGFPDMTDFTISIWVKLKNSSMTRVEPIIGKNPYWMLGVEHLSAGENEIPVSGNYLVFDISGTSFYSYNPFPGSSSGQIPCDTFFHVAIQYTSKSASPELIFYVNGERTNSYVPSNTLQWPSFGPNVVIGSNNVVNHPGFAGSIDDINIYNRLINPSEITNLHRDTTNRTSCLSTVGIEEFEETTDIHIYPNPTTTYIRIDGERIREVNLFTNLGQMITSQKISGISPEIDLSHLPRGIYILQVGSENGRSWTKILKQ